MKTKTDLFALLANIGAKPTTHEHAAVFRVEEGKEIKDAQPGAHSKNLFLKDAKGQLWLISAADTTVIDLKRLPAVIGSGRLSFGNAELLYETLGVSQGSVTALALINDPGHRVRFVLDAVLAKAELVNFHPLVNTATTALTHDDLFAFFAAIGVVPAVVDFVEMKRLPSVDPR